MQTLAVEELQKEIHGLGPWFQNMNLGGIPTAPDHFLGDYPQIKWRSFSKAIPADLTGRSVLDIGCNAGFYSLEMKRRGASRVLGIDEDSRYLAQARLAAGVLGLEVEYREMSVYDVASLGETFDLVLFMGVLYHLRYPLLALDLVHHHAVGSMMVFQSMQRGYENCLIPTTTDYDFQETEVFKTPGFPCLYFIEDRYAGDPTNWWIPNSSCVEAMLRSAGFEIQDHPETEVYICRSCGKESSWWRP